MTHQEEKVVDLERKLSSIRRRAETELDKGWMTDKQKVEELRVEYRRLHRRWITAKNQTAMDF